MSSSTFEVKESSKLESEVEFEENGILSTQVDGEVPRDHTYTKEPDNQQDDEMIDESDKVEDVVPPSPVKGRGRGRPSASPKKSVAKTPAKKAASPPRKSRGGRKAAEENNVEDEAKNGHVETEKPVEEKPAKANPKRGRKRKVEEKENVIDHSIVEEVQNITDEAGVNSNKEEDEEEENKDEPESPKKRAKKAPATPKAKAPAKEKKTPAKKAAKENSNETVQTAGVPKGWVKKLVERQSGQSAGQVDVYIFSPEGQKFRSRPELIAFLARTKSKLKIDNFDFSKAGGKASVSAATPKKAAKKSPPAPAKSPEKKKKKPATPAKRLMVKIGNRRGKTPAKENKSPAKGSRGKSSKKRA